MDDLNENLSEVIIEIETEPEVLVATAIDLSRTPNKATKKSKTKPKATSKSVPKAVPVKVLSNTQSGSLYNNFQFNSNFQPTRLDTEADLKAKSDEIGNFVQFTNKKLLGNLIDPKKPNTEQNSTVSTSDFYINFIDSKNVEKYFLFSLMPAMETSLRGNNNGMNVPEVKPGISFKTDMNTKKITIPGARPIFQSLSIDKTVIQITAALIGNERVVYRTTPDSKNQEKNNAISQINTSSRGNRLNASTLAFNNLTDSESFDAFSSAIYIDTNIVQVGRPILLTIKTNTSIQDEPVYLKLKCLIQSFRYIARYQDRCYYSLDLLSTDYLDAASRMISSNFFQKNSLQNP